MRFDLQVIASWIEPGSRVLDLGCRTGSLLAHLTEQKSIIGTGIEIDEDAAGQAIAKGLSVIHGDIYEEIEDYPDNSFDYVILSQALMQVLDPGTLIREMLRVGRLGIVSFPNFTHYRNRLQMLFTGRAPMSKELPYEWHNTPNIRVIPIIDFRRFCKQLNVPIVKEVAISTHHHDEKGKVITFLPNLFATFGIFMLGQSR
ncbi:MULTISPECIES: methionine biosynthesis protein MetW [unclassified Pseudodesulfovibrio]|uniref:methionine biosynthesis protein MetW n=1 Tax=unclassified Pseudodesulfovibrio TaxID=2661612 RepID=UPI000FEB8CA4|nr:MULTISPECIES: methionine biosynthesis protein MetW [unclassified Pseudodesulfovibrio]MCJ2166200.1 methionine biosynthesis protein MetW [Pseudodesulfovibrio sp. S3-i]RWU02333.1 methionine biosynthesis protein MetW [Pseudodesulfovibrio sp. S3]